MGSGEMALAGSIEVGCAVVDSIKSCPKNFSNFLPVLYLMSGL
jgi:hypothetical protein